MTIERPSTMAVLEREEGSAGTRKGAQATRQPYRARGGISGHATERHESQKAVAAFELIRLSKGAKGCELSLISSELAVRRATRTLSRT